MKTIFAVWNGVHGCYLVLAEDAAGAIMIARELGAEGELDAQSIRSGTWVQDGDLNNV